MAPCLTCRLARSRYFALGSGGLTSSFPFGRLIAKTLSAGCALMPSSIVSIVEFELFGIRVSKRKAPELEPQCIRRDHRQCVGRASLGPVSVGPWPHVRLEDM